MDRIVIDDVVTDIDDGDMTDATSTNGLADVKQVSANLAISADDTNAGRQLCRTMVSQIVSLKLPESIRKKPELVAIIKMQQAFEEFTLQSMFAVVAQAVQLLNELTMTDAIYTAEGILDPFRLQSVLATQQHVMNIIQQFNVHVRRLPSVLTDMIRDAEYSQIIQVESVAQKEIGNTSSKPISVLLKEASEQLENETTDAVNETVSEQVVNIDTNVTIEDTNITLD